MVEYEKFPVKNAIGQTLRIANIPKRKKIEGKWYKLFDIYSVVGGNMGHKMAIGMAEDLRRGRGYRSVRTQANWGYTAIYTR